MGIDNASLAAFGSWPIDRRNCTRARSITFAPLARSVIVYDVQFAGTTDHDDGRLADAADHDDVVLGGLVFDDGACSRPRCLPASNDGWRSPGFPATVALGVRFRGTEEGYGTLAVRAAGGDKNAA